MENDDLNLSNSHSVVVEMDYEQDNPQQNNESQNSDSHSQNDEVTVEDYTPEEEVSESVEADSKKPRSKRWEKERKAREEKYLLSQALAEERRRNLELQNYLNRSVDNNTLSRADKAIKDLEEAEYAHAAALETGDAHAAAKASTALIQANLAVERAANSKMYSKDNDDTPQIDPTAYAANNLLNGWLADNPEFNEDSDSFNGELVSRVAPLIDKLDAKLKRQGQSHLISSPMYFDVIDTLVSQMKSGKNYRRPNTAPVSSRSQNHYSSHSSSRPMLTEQQKRVAVGCNMSEEQYANWLKKYERDKIEQENNRGSYAY